MRVEEVSSEGECDESEEGFCSFAEPPRAGEGGAGGWFWRRVCGEGGGVEGCKGGEGRGREGGDVLLGSRGGV